MNDSPLSRRNFLAAAAVAGGLTLARGIGSAQAADAPAAAGGGTSESGPTVLRWGIIGTGTRGGGTHVPVLKSAPGSELVALCDTSEERLTAASTRHGKKVATYSDYQKLLADAHVNAVVIATPNLMHREMLQAALQAGKHVLCEKPAGISPADAVEIKRLADTAKTVVMFGMQYRNHARQHKIIELIAAGRIGKPRYIIQNVSRGDWNTSKNVWQYSDPKVNGGTAGNWRFSHAASGGTLNEFSCHYFDLVHWVAGAIPQRVSCDGGISVYKDGRNTWDHATVTMTYPGELKAVHSLCLFGPSRNTLQVFGEEGSLETQAAGSLLISSPGRRGRGGAKSQEIKAPDAEQRSNDDATLALYEDFVACVKTGKKPDAGPDRAVASSKTCWLAELSAERKGEVGWADLPG